MRRALVVAFGAALCSLPAAACINETGTTLRGHPVGTDFGPSMIAGTLDDHDARRSRAAETLPDVIARAKARGDYESLNDLAAATIRLGRPASAARLLEVLERRWPGRYETATNLGTAYELLGRNEDALRWIREGIARNPQSHAGTEWVHVRILEAKVAGRASRADASLLGLDFGRGAVPSAPASLPAGNDGEAVSLWDLAQGLRIQLDERTDLVAPPDPVVASLMFDLATLEMAVGSVENAAAIYDLAVEYGAPESPLLGARRAAIEAAAKRGAMVHEDDRLYGSCAICAPPDDPAE